MPSDAICHAESWGSRPVFGKRRFMSYESTRSKFDSARYIKQMNAMVKP